MGKEGYHPDLVRQSFDHLIKSSINGNLEITMCNDQITICQTFYLNRAMENSNSGLLVSDINYYHYVNTCMHTDW